ncbi:hypothetical protein HC823_01875 [Candidatus Gracilibacteria bacterium]|nr:hypothetical protein [Candidatus Gracilibacteria bacterium]
MKTLFSHSSAFENTSFVWRNMEVKNYEEQAEKVAEETEGKEKEEKYNQFVEKQEGLNGKVDQMKKIEATEKKQENPEGVIENTDAWGDVPKPAPEKNREEKEASETLKDEDSRPTKSLAQRIGKFLGFVKEGDEGLGYNKTEEVEQEIAQEEQNDGVMGGMAAAEKEENFVDAKLDKRAETEGENSVG